MREMKLVTVGVGELGVSCNVIESIVTYALGSCVAVTLHDPVAEVGGLLHFMLPDSSLDPDRANCQPSLFADTGVPLLFHRALEMGAEMSRIQVNVTGGAQLIDNQSVFRVGERNCLAVKEILRKMGVMIRREDLGGAVSRSVRLDVGSGRVSVRITRAPSEEVRL